MYSIKHGDTKGCAEDRARKNGSNNDIFTPPQLAKKMWEIAYNETTYEPQKILDPCCGKGALISGIPEEYHKKVIAIDNNDDYVLETKDKYKLCYWYKTNFFYFQTNPEDENYTQFDIILMNPPFSLQKGNCRIPFWDHALSMLKDDGVIVSICPDYYLVNSEKRKQIYANNIKQSYILPKFLFETNAKKKGKQPLHTHVVVLVKKCPNTTFLFL